MARGRNSQNKQFWESVKMTNATYIQYYNRLMEYSVSMGEWRGLPSTINQRFLELILFSDGKCVFFKDESLGYVALRMTSGGYLDVYGEPTNRTAYASNGYMNADLNESNSVIIYNNMIHTSSMLEVENYAKRLYDIDRSIDVNAKAQKTPILIMCDESERLTLKNAYAKYEGNEPVIYAGRNFNPNAVRVLTTGAPYVCDKLYQLKTQIWNEALTYLGISNINITKKERLITDEVTRNQGGTVASRYSRINARQQACEKINELFGLNVSFDFREDVNVIDDEEQIGGEQGE